MATKSELREAFELLRDVARVARLFQQDNVHCGGVTFVQFTILDHVDQAGGSLELARLHDALAVEKSTTTRLVEPLVDKGFLARTPAPHDARAVRLEITAEGRAAHGEYWACLSKSLRHAVDGLPKARSAEVKRAVREFTQTVGRLCGDACCG